MTQLMFRRSVLLISVLTLLGCTSQKARVFGTDMPSMKATYTAQFTGDPTLPPATDQRPLTDSGLPANSPFRWLPNPTLHLYVFEHLSPTGLPVPGYTTFFKLYATDHIALPSEQGTW